LVGTIDHAILFPEGRTRPDDNHVYLWVHVADGPMADAYECAFNIHLNSGEAPGSKHPNRTGQDGALVFSFTGSA
jgi:hypothetical protein